MVATASPTDNPGMPARLIQITDTHLGLLDGETLLGLNTDQSLEDVLELIEHEQSAVAAVVCTGDVASTPEPACYRRFIDTMARYFDCPMGWLPGNHDLAGVMAAINHPGKPAHRTMEVGGWLLVLLDTSVPGFVHGDLSAPELAFLQTTLVANSQRPTLVMLHHQPVPVGSEWIDQYIVRNHEAFFAVVDEHPQVKAISWGHVHQLYERQRKGQLMLATPSTCVQFKPQCDDFTVDTVMPGYRWFDLYPDGTLKTGISRVTGKQYGIDYRSAGY
ncbi:3',5'-cyclic-AMP phosphodiesterase [Gilvimarinus algae]|uniref:3',5'-cyclic-AMP phosphodiesterase n=1 Tax=Gilvimarinus algae TaxID=3058037 RepID=A0ABT8T9T6_9GAMM|nr:3',5'-cyclic-AMP phosphodiesterase [Gilvimarinus sp. SDUM040014]MDO3380884.1 3',5'-cyclic-AMP phosphodiesterase [Gilvimarinus sp. SDUM040014]